MTFSLDDARKLAHDIFKRNTDYIGVPYMDHLRTISDALEMYDEDLQVVGLLHTILERTDWTEQNLLDEGLPEKSVVSIRALTYNWSKQTRAMYFRQVRTDEDASLIKIACTAHNILPERLNPLKAVPYRDRVANFGFAQRILWPSVYEDDLRDILKIVNPDLLTIVEQLKKDEKL